MKTIIAILIIAFLGTSIANAAIYKWRDEEGKLHFSDTKPVTKTDIKEIEVNDNVSPVSEAEPTHEQRGYVVKGKASASRGVVTISGRIDSGPECNNLRVEAYAVNKSGDMARIVTSVARPRSNSMSHFSGIDNVRYYGKGSWKFLRAETRCTDYE